MALSDLYKSIVIEHNREPRNYGSLTDCTHQARGLNALCGDDIVVALRLRDDTIEAVMFSGQASAITMASASLMTCRAQGRSTASFRADFADVQQLFDTEPVSQALRDRLGDVAALEGVRDYPSRIKSAVLPWYALRAALRGEPVASTE